VGVAGVLVTADVVRQFTPEFGAGLAFRYDYENWRFSGSNGGLATPPWGNVNRPGFAIPLNYAVSPSLFLSAQPTVQWAYESGADTGDAVIWGATFAATQAFSRDLLLGLGVGVFYELEETRAFPFLIVDWKIDDRWRLKNPFRAGPAGGAGVELAYKASDAWEFAAGGTWRVYRFRLDRDGPYPDGIGESRSVPLFLRASYQLTRDARLDAYGGVLVGGKLTVMDPNGNDVAKESFDAAPVLGFTLSTRF
jgi:hypothetical protein